MTLWVMSDGQWVIGDGYTLSAIGYRPSAIGYRLSARKEHPIPGELIPIVLFLVIGAVGMTFSPLGRALARRVGGDKGEHADTATLAEVDALREEVQALRHEVGDLQERLDFAERLLAQAREKGQLGPGNGK